MAQETILVEWYSLYITTHHNNGSIPAVGIFFFILHMYMLVIHVSYCPLGIGRYVVEW